MEYSLSAEPRTTLGRRVKDVRAAGQLPVVLYGKGIETKSLQINAKTFIKLLHDAGSSTLVNLKIEGEKPVKVLIKESQLHPLSGTPVHVDLYQVNMKEKIRTEIPLEFIGESIVVTELDGKLVTSLDAIEVECLPDDLVQNIEVDLSALKEFDDAIHVSDIKVPQGIEVLTDPELTIVVAQAPLTEAELEEELAADVTEAEAIEGIEGAKEEVSEGDAEGEDSAKASEDSTE